MSGAQFEGTFKEDKATGYGVMVFENGDRYEGNWILGVKNG